jgi:alpha-beta hydrolase superfamily lysophospholipase
MVLRNARLDMAWGLFLAMDDGLAAAPRVALPTLILFGARDPLVPGGPARALIDALPPAGPERRRVAVYADGWHMLLRDLDAARVDADVAAWILTRRSDPAAALPSGADRAPPPG